MLFDEGPDGPAGCCCRFAALFREDDGDLLGLQLGYLLNGVDGMLMESSEDG